MDLPSVKHFFAFLQKFFVQSFSTFSPFPVENPAGHNILGVCALPDTISPEGMNPAPPAHTGYII